MILLEYEKSYNDAPFAIVVFIMRNRTLPRPSNNGVAHVARE